MTSALLEFRPDRLGELPADADSIDILQTLADLHTDLHYIEKAIDAIELLAVARLGLDAGEVRKSVSRKKKAKASTGKCKGRVLAFRRSP